MCLAIGIGGCRMARKKYAYSYNVCDQANEELFHKQCAALVKYIPGLEPERLLQDVDGTLIQMYHHKRGEIKVVNDRDTWALYIDSDFDIDPYFE